MKKFTLTPELLFTAYSQGFFPMPDEGTGDIRWYRPDPRAILPLDNFHISRSLKRKLNKKTYSVTFNQAFSEVINACSARPDTWINDEIRFAYNELHNLNAAHSVEIWEDGLLAGGVYGPSIGGAFFAESMFHRKTNASKIALFHLVERLKEKNFILLECQFLTDHLKSLGAIEIPDADYLVLLKKALCVYTNFE